MQDLINEIADKVGITIKQVNSALHIAQSNNKEAVTTTPAVAAESKESFIKKMKKKASGSLNNLEDIM